MIFRLFFFGMVVLCASAHAVDESDSLIGRYNLQGAMEMASELIIRKDGTFSGGIMYGSAEAYVKGDWEVEAGALLLQRDRELATKVAKDVYFDLASEMDLAQIEEAHELDKGRGFDLARKNYVLELRYAIEPIPPPIKPVDVYLEFSTGLPARLVWRKVEEWRLLLPYDDKRTLTKIGFRKRGESDAIQWFEVSGTTRWLTLGWKGKAGKSVIFNALEESDLNEANNYYRNRPKDLEDLQKNYLITFYYDEVVPAPAINPINIFWRFDDGSEKQEVWADSQQPLVLHSFGKNKILQKVGFQEQGSASPIQWAEVTPTARWLTFYWQGYSSDISSLFDNMTLEILSNCLVFDSGNGKACFRKVAEQ